MDLLEVNEWEIPHKYGLICTMGYAGRGNDTGRTEPVGESRGDRGGVSEEYPLADKAGVPNVITFSGNRKGMSDEEGPRNMGIGLNA